MKKYFEYHKIAEVRKELIKIFGREYTDENCSVGAIINKSAYKCIKKDLKSIKNINTIYFAMPFEKREELIGKFFPTKLADLKSNGEYTTKNVYYSDLDNKIHWEVEQNGNSRHFKLATDNYLSRVDDERKYLMLEIKKTMDPIFGYWISPQGYVTDGNIINTYYRDCHKIIFPEDIIIDKN